MTSNKYSGKTILFNWPNRISLNKITHCHPHYTHNSLSLQHTIPRFVNHVNEHTLPTNPTVMSITKLESVHNVHFTQESNPLSPISPRNWIGPSASFRFLFIGRCIDRCFNWRIQVICTKPTDKTIDQRNNVIDYYHINPTIYWEQRAPPWPSKIA